MGSASARYATLVVLEYGAIWPRWLNPVRRGDMAIMTQTTEGSPSSLIPQIASRTTQLESMGWRIHGIVLVTNGSVQPEVSASRSVLIRGLMARLNGIGGGSLVLTVDERAGTRAGNALNALAASLKPHLRTTGVELTVRQGDRLQTYSTTSIRPSLAEAS